MTQIKKIRNLVAQHIEDVFSNTVIDGIIAVDKGDFGKDFENYNPPKPTTEIDIRLAINTYFTPPKKILFIYYKKDDAWYQVDGSQEGGSSGCGDMYKSVYDPDLDNKVENADHADEADLAHDAQKLGGHEPNYYALSDHSHALEALTNVDVNNVKNGQVLVYDSTNNVWVNQDQQVGGDMYKSDYDSNNDGKVDSAETADYATNAGHADDADHAINSDKLENHPASYFATSGHSHDLGELNDVELNSPTDSQVLGYDASTHTWKNRDIGGGDMYKSTYDPDNDGKVENADHADEADHATNADKLNNHPDTDFMLKTSYDSNNDGKVDNAEHADDADKLQGHPPSDFASSDHSHALDDLTNVTITSAQDGDILSYDATNNVWKNKVFTCGDMQKSVYDKNNDGKVDEAHHADIADSLSDTSNFMLKDDYDSNRDGKVDNAEHADNADKLGGHPASDFSPVNHSHNLNELLDVNADSPQDGQALVYNNSSHFWEAKKITDVDHATNSDKLENHSAIDFGANGIVSAGSDLNSIVRSGFYRLENNLQNAPSSDIEWGQLIVSRGNAGDTVLQIASDHSSNKLYWRSGNPPEAGGSGSWGPWRTLYPQDSGGGGGGGSWSQNFAETGYTQMPNGLILQWGKTNVDTQSGWAEVSFPITFPNACLNVVGTAFHDGYVVIIGSLFKDSFLVKLENPTNASLTAGTFFWQAIGY